MTNLSSIAGATLWMFVASLMMMAALQPVEISPAGEAWAERGCAKAFAPADCGIGLA